MRACHARTQSLAGLLSCGKFSNSVSCSNVLCVCFDFLEEFGGFCDPPSIQLSPRYWFWLPGFRKIRIGSLSQTITIVGRRNEKQGKQDP